jgi:integrase
MKVGDGKQLPSHFYSNYAFSFGGDQKMKQGFDIHCYERRLKAYEKSVQESKELTEKNKELISKFRDYCLLQDYSIARIVKFYEILKTFGTKLGKDFDKATREDVEKFAVEVQKRKLSPWTRTTYNQIIRRFYRWINGDKTCPEIVSWLPTRIKQSDKKMLSDKELITEEEIQKVIEACENTRDKALLSTLFESGCRIGEIATLQIKNVNFDENGVVITVQGKTGSRKIRLIASSGHLANWINQHPQKQDPEAPVWTSIGTTNHNKKVKYDSIRFRIKMIFQKAGITKRCNPHLFRHSRATLMANHLTEFQMNQYFGWTQGSEMPSTYVHMTGRDLDGAIMSLNGIEIPKDKQEAKLQPLICTRCRRLNSFGTVFCGICGSPLTQEGKIKIQIQEQNIQLTEDVFRKLLEDERVQKILKEKVIEI